MLTGGIGGEIAARIAEKAFDCLDGPVLRIAAPDTPSPFSPTLEEAYLPNAAGIVHFDIAEFPSRRAGIKRHDWYTGTLHLLDQTRFHLRGHNRNTLHFAVEEAVDTQLRAFRAVLGIGDDYFIMALDGNSFEGFDQVWKEGIRNVGDDESENVTLA